MLHCFLAAWIFALLNKADFKIPKFPALISEGRIIRRKRIMTMNLPVFSSVRDP